MISTQMAIQRFHRDMTVSALVRLGLGTMMVAMLLLGPVLGLGAGGTVAMAGVLGVWMVLSYRSARGTHLAVHSPILIATGQFEAAEQQIDRALSAFSLFRSTKLLSLHHLAVLRHAQGRWAEAAELCQALLGQKLGSLEGMGKPSRLILADALLELGDVQRAYTVISELHRQRLNLVEAMNLMVLQLDYGWRVGAWDAMMEKVETKAQLAELMPMELSLRAQGLLALAAKKTGKTDWEEWLKRRVELLGDVEKLVKEREILRELW